LYSWRIVFSAGSQMRGMSAPASCAYNMLLLSLCIELACSAPPNTSLATLPVGYYGSSWL
jgi:hypothetical protein